MGERKPYDKPCKKCGSTNQVLMIAEGRKSIYCRNCSNFEDIYVSNELQQYWDDEAKKEEAANAQQMQNIPKCPTCQSTSIKKITMTSKAVNTVMFGIYGSKRHKTFHCNNCGYEW